MNYAYNYIDRTASKYKVKVTKYIDIVQQVCICTHTHTMWNVFVCL